jgi:hypothetical protein
MKKLCFGYLFEVFALIALFLVPLAQLWESNVIGYILLIVFAGLLSHAISAAQAAKKELGVTKGRFQKIFIGFGFTLLCTVLFGAIIAGLAVIVSGVMSLVKVFTASPGTASGALGFMTGVTDFFGNNFKVIAVAFALAVAAAYILMLIDEFMVIKRLREIAGRRRMGWRTLKFIWPASVAARLCGLGLFLYIEYSLVIKELTLQEDYWKNWWIFGIVIAFHLLFAALFMRTGEFMERYLPQIPGKSKEPFRPLSFLEDELKKDEG